MYTIYSFALSKENFFMALSKENFFMALSKDNFFMALSKENFFMVNESNLFQIDTYYGSYKKDMLVKWVTHHSVIPKPKFYYKF